MNRQHASPEQDTHHIGDSRQRSSDDYLFAALCNAVPESQRSMVMSELLRLAEGLRVLN